MTILSSRGVQFASRALPLPQAMSFLACVSANTTRFRDATIKPAPRRSDRFIVTYEAVNPEVAERIRAAAQAERDGRAEDQRELYAIRRYGQGFQVVNLESGKVYDVDPTRALCSCPDHHYRCAGNGLHCKHQRMVEVEARRVVAIPPRIAQIRARMAEDFPA